MLYSSGKVGLKLVVLNGSRVVAVDYLEEWIDELSLDRDPKLSNKIVDLIDCERLTSIEIKIVEDFAEQRWIISS